MYNSKKVTKDGKKMKIAICDDDRVFHSTIERFTTLYAIEKSREVYTKHFNCGEALPIPNEFDVIVMDYEMGGMNGIETAKKLRAAKSDAVIIFISAYPEAALDSFEVNTFRFLRKPLEKRKFFKALDDYFISFDQNSIVKFNTHEGGFTLKVDDIIYLEGNRGHTTIRTKDKYYCIYETLKKVAAKIPGNKFVRCHKTFVANLAHVKSHSYGEVVFDNDEKAEIGRTYSRNFKDKLQNYIMQYNEGQNQ